MRRSRSIKLVAALLPLFVACGDATGPKDDVEPCTDETGSVEVTVTAGMTPTFDWNPQCAVAMLLIEEDAHDMWGVTTDDTLWDDPETANLITPPVTYGTAPSGTETFQEPTPLATGHTYEVVLWRVVAESSTVSCQQRFENLCLMAVHLFSR